MTHFMMISQTLTNMPSNCLIDISKLAETTYTSHIWYNADDLSSARQILHDVNLMAADTDGVDTNSQSASLACELSCWWLLLGKRKI